MHFTDTDKLVLIHGVVDLRKGVFGLVALLEDAQDGCYYFFSNRSRSLIKIVYIDGQGSWLVTRKIKTVFKWPEQARATTILTAEQANLLCSGNSIYFI